MPTKKTKKTKKTPASRRTARSKKTARRAPRRSNRVPRSEEFRPITNIKVVGVGGGGSSAVSRMSRDFTRGVEFIAINTDHQALDQCDVRHKIYIGRNLTKGLGAGMNPDLGRQAAEENRSEIAEALAGADMVFVAAGLGGGTGSGAGPIVAEVAKQSGALTFAVVTRPFEFEGVQRARIAEESIAQMKDRVDALIVVPNDRIFSIISKDTAILKAFEAIDDVLKNALRGIVDLIVAPGMINVDFADIRSIVSDAGHAIVGMGLAGGQDRAMTAVNAALNSPLLEVSAEGAHGIVLGISGGRDLKMTEINDAAKLVRQTVDPGAKIIFGAYYDRTLKQGHIKVTLVATGFSASSTNSLFGGASAGARSYLGEDDAPRPFAAREDSGSSGAGGPAAGKRDPFRKTDDDDGVVEKEPKLPKRSFLGGRDDKDKDKKDDGGSDPWDIPTFLRKRRK
jgi:cell division protein FtsZ